MNKQAFARGFMEETDKIAVEVVKLDPEKFKKMILGAGRKLSGAVINLTKGVGMSAPPQPKPVYGP